MPRRPDAGLEKRILNAAQRLWHEGGERALTMRILSRAAGTNTPAVHRRFKNRHDIMFALMQRVQQDIARTLQQSRSPEETCLRYVDFASSHPEEYKLLHAHASKLSQGVQSRRRLARWNSTPMLTLIRKQLAERLGGSVADHSGPALAMWALGVLIAMAVMHRPSLLIADEPTSALDILTQSEVLHLFSGLSRKLGMSILYISHDLLSVATISQRVAVMEGGEILECRNTAELFANPIHP